VEYDQEAFDDLDEVDAFDIPVLRTAIGRLQYEALSQTMRRCPLDRPVSWCPDATWQQRCGNYRIFYRVEDRTVRVLRVKWKGSRTTEDIGR